MPFVERLKNIKVNDRYMLFRSCAISNKYPGMESATKAVFNELGIVLEESEDQTCCGGSAIVFTAIGQVASTILMTARNLTISEEMKLDLMVMCNGCFKNLAEFGAYINKNPDIKDLVNEKLSKIQRKYNGTSNVNHVMEILYLLKDKLKEKTKKPLHGLKFATHYGCHYLYGAKNSAVDDPFFPTILEEIIESLGGENVEYSENRSCCGSGVLSNTYIDNNAAVQTTVRKLDSLNESKADAVVVTCPYCLMNLDRMQYQLSKSMDKGYNMPVVNIAQIVGLALGIDPQCLGFDAHVIDVGKLLRKVGGEP